MTGPGRTEHVTCLGCGCGCDDITVTVADGRIVDATPVCPLGRAWFGDGKIPSAVLLGGSPASLDQAIAEAASVLARAAGRCLVYLAPDLSSQAQRLTLEIADLLRGTVDSATSGTAAGGLLAAQRRGRAGATLGEIRNRADALLFWAVDPAQRYPRYLQRYALEPAGTHIPEGRAGRFVISVSVGAEKALGEADLTLELDPSEEITALSLMRASVLGHSTSAKTSPRVAQAIEIAGRLARARYAVLVHDAEPTAERRDPLRIEALIALTQALNQPTRAALSSLRAGGNRLGAEVVLTWQTGYPFAVDYSRGFPRYTPGDRGLDRLPGGAFKAALVAGSPVLEDSTREALSGVSSVAIGPRASQAAFKARVAIDTGVAGIHEGGTAYRMDEVPLPLRPSLSGPRSTADTLGALSNALRRELGGSRQ
jgi:formylmethanofuran dehydrogenase subunit B